MELDFKSGQKIGSDYLLLERLGEGGMSVVFKAKDIPGDREVAIKFLKPSRISSYLEERIRFKKEIEAIGKFSHPNIAKLFSVGEYENNPYIVMELVNGESLHDLLSRGEVFGIEKSVFVIKQICQALNYVHSKGLLHRDMKPGNIILDKDNGNVKLVDFGLALVMELGQIKDSAEIIGTFGYMSPELTGIINKPIYESSDLYSLGIVFYRLLAEELPFKGDSVSEIIHQQVALVPKSPIQINHNIPNILEKIIMKLLEKEPDLRYQSAIGLLHDLELFSKGDRDFAIGAKDQKLKLTYRVRLIGRDREFNRILKLFNKAMNFSGKVCLIGGEAGIGKTRLVEEMREVIYEHDVQFLVGRCIMQENKFPYQPFRDIVDEYIVSVKRQGDSAVDREKKRIIDLFADLRALLVKLNANIKQIIGEVPEVVHLDSDKENKRFTMVCARFICSLVEKDKSFAIFIDDLQWADEGSLNILEEILNIISDYNLFLIGTYRDNEVADNHSLSKIKRKAKNFSLPLEDIKLDLFNYERMNRFVAKILGESEDKAKMLTRYIMEKSRGNPFFSLTIIRELVERKALVWMQGFWEEDWGQINQLPVSVDIVDIILLRAKELSEGENNLLSVAALVGKRFYLDMLYNLIKEDKEKIIVFIDDAINKQFLEKGLNPGEVAFVHDEVREAFYSKLNEIQRKKYHLAIAEVIEKKFNSKEQEVLFELAHHYIEAGVNEKILEYGLPAAEKAKESYANKEAIRYYQVVLDVLSKNYKKSDSRWLRANEGLADVNLTTGNNDQAIKICKEIIDLEKTNLDKARLYRKIQTAYLKKGEWVNCEKAMFEGLRLLGEHLPRSNSAISISLFHELLVHVFYCIFPRCFISFSRQKEKTKYKEIMNFYRIQAWVYILSDIRKFTRTVLRAVNIGNFKVGKSKELSFAVMACASLSMAASLFKLSSKYHEIELKIRKDLDDQWGVAQSYQYLGYCMQWQARFSESIRAFQESREKFERMGDVWELDMVRQGLGHNYYFQAQYEQANQVFSSFIETAKRLDDKYAISDGNGWLCLIYTEWGKFEKADELGKIALLISEKEKIWFITCFALANLGNLEMEKGNYDSAVKYLERSKKLFEKNTFLKNYTIYLYPCLADAYIEKYKADSLNMFEDDRKHFLKKIKTACLFALKQTKAWSCHYAWSLRVTAKYYAFTGNTHKAESFFGRSIEHARRIGRNYEVAKAFYENGRFLDSINEKDLAKEKYKSAYDIFHDISAFAYMQKCAGLLGYEIEVQKKQTSRDRLKLAREMTTVIDTSRYISSILDLDELLEKIMDKAIQLVGAERGVILLYREETEDTPQLEVRVARNISRNEVETDMFNTSRGIIERVIREKQSIVIDDASKEDGLRQEFSVIKYGLRSIVCLPIIAREDLLGVIYLENRLVSGIANREDLKVLELIVRQAGISIENAILYKRAITDSLTSLYNRNFFDNYLVKSVNQANRYNSFLSILMIDIDDFKRINDSYGHRAGDLVLKSVSVIFGKRIRKSDLVARYGGEEFVVILPATSIEGAKRAAETIRSLVEESSFLFDAQTEKKEQVDLKVTISIGVAQLIFGEDRLQLLEKADQAMYKAKSLGKNRVEIWQS
ncbi:MAG: diguanylate cyclase [Candidatus Gygaella obscura]|nr:diguanylate cyclase [Candidatus Gygaella obscura]